MAGIFTAFKTAEDVGTNYDYGSIVYGHMLQEEDF
jgi:hypothetical protein